MWPSYFRHAVESGIGRPGYVVPSDEGILTAHRYNLFYEVKKSLSLLPPSRNLLDVDTYTDFVLQSTDTNTMGARTMIDIELLSGQKESLRENKLALLQNKSLIDKHIPFGMLGAAVGPVRSDFLHGTFDPDTLDFSNCERIQYNAAISQICYSDNVLADSPFVAVRSDTTVDFYKTFAEPYSCSYLTTTQVSLDSITPSHFKNSQWLLLRDDTVALFDVQLDSQINWMKIRFPHDEARPDLQACPIRIAHSTNDSTVIIARGVSVYSQDTRSQSPAVAAYDLKSECVGIVRPAHEYHAFFITGRDIVWYDCRMSGRGILSTNHHMNTNSMLRYDSCTCGSETDIVTVSGMQEAGLLHRFGTSNDLPGISKIPSFLNLRSKHDIPLLSFSMVSPEKDQHGLSELAIVGLHVDMELMAHKVGVKSKRGMSRSERPVDQYPLDSGKFVPDGRSIDAMTAIDAPVSDETGVSFRDALSLFQTFYGSEVLLRNAAKVSVRAIVNKIKNYISKANEKQPTRYLRLLYILEECGKLISEPPDSITVAQQLVDAIVHDDQLDLIVHDMKIGGMSFKGSAVGAMYDYLEETYVESLSKDAVTEGGIDKKQRVCLKVAFVCSVSTIAVRTEQGQEEADVDLLAEALGLPADEDSNEVIQRVLLDWDVLPDDWEELSLAKDARRRLLRSRARQRPGSTTPSSSQQEAPRLKLQQPSAGLVMSQIERGKFGSRKKKRKTEGFR
ncbi:hypothetical protein CANCADRAFT_131210 [Tortispora caseinolytica NRRL Y-17796]|uniref:RRN6 K-rich C-terminal domain-containing protein n=1 Tax=Tortispora caseinolytica NRRL Y-17796 TaxID=767744 RepID=A0A1E4TB35_9ASCO|nr:hypothetical protein CANCADRAFT_131210 [Tortispora caseinolytica NRRL Y-17796]